MAGATVDARHDVNLVAAARFQAARLAPNASSDSLLAHLHPRVEFNTLGKNLGGAAAVAAELVAGNNGELSRKLRWGAPVAAGAQVRLSGERQSGTWERGLIVTLHFAEDLISKVQQQRTAPPPPVAQPIVLPKPLQQMVNRALVERHPMLMAYTDPQGQPVLSFRGSVQAFSDDQLAMWIRSPDGAFVRAIHQNPRVALVYRNEDSKATYNFQGRARVSALEADRQRVFAAAPEAERAHDFAMLGVVVIVDLDRVEGYSGLGPSGQMGQIRLLRGASWRSGDPSI